MNKKLDEILAAVTDEVATDKQLAELNELLIKDKNARDIYKAYCATHIELENQASRKAPIEIERLKSSRSLLRIVAVAASFVLAAVLVTLNLLEASKVSVGYIVDSEGNNKEEKPLYVGKQNFPSGISLLKINNGVVISLEGPASIDVMDQNQIFLSNGKLTAFVPEQAIGFTVNTAHSKIVDLGTEFGVETGPNGSEVHVFQGEVRLDREGSAERNLTAGQVRSIDGSIGHVLSSDVQFEKNRDALTGGAIKDYFNEMASESMGSIGSNAGWVSGWELYERFGTPSKLFVTKEFPLMADSDNYLNISSTPKSDRGVVRPVLRRQYRSIENVDLAKPHTVEFLFRLDVAPEEIEKIFIFDASKPRIWPSSEYTWSMSAGRKGSNGMLEWEIWNPFENTEKYSRLEVKQSAVYKIVIYVEPLESRQMVTISDGKTTIANSMDNGTAVKFKNGAKEVGGFLHFIVDAKSGTNGTYSIDNLRIRNTPQAFLDRKIQLQKLK